jgi:hypothetical protein
LNRMIVVPVIVALVTSLTVTATATTFEMGISQQKVYGQNVATGCPAIYKYGCDACPAGQHVKMGFLHLRKHCVPNMLGH